jgi:hypothetical protein
MTQKEIITSTLRGGRAYCFNLSQRLQKLQKSAHCDVYAKEIEKLQNELNRHIALCQQLAAELETPNA